MDAYIKVFVIGYLSGIATSLLCFIGCRIYRWRVQRTAAGNTRARDLEQQQSDTCGELTERLEQQSDTCKELAGNEQSVAKLLQKAKNILNNGKYTNNN